MTDKLLTDKLWFYILRSINPNLNNGNLQVLINMLIMKGII